MELHMQSHRWKHRIPDWLATSMAGLVGETLVIMLEFFWSTMALNENPWHLVHKIATMIMGRDALEGMSLFSFSIVETMLVLHSVLGAPMGMILGATIAPFHFDSSPDMLAATGVVFGIVAYVVNFYGMTTMFPQFVSECGSGPLLANLLSGVVTTIMHDMLGQRMPEPTH